MSLNGASPRLGNPVSPATQRARQIRRVFVIVRLTARQPDSNRLYATLIDPISSTRSPRRGKVHGEGETPAQGGKPSVAVCRQENLSEKRRARFGQRSCPRLARSAGSSANHAKRIGRTQPRRARGGACALDNLGTICAQLPTGAGGSPFALRFRVA